MILTIEAIGFLVTAAAIILGIVAWRLSSSPLSLGFLTPYVEQALNPSDGSFTVTVDAAHLTWAGWARNLDVQASGVKVVGGDGEPLADVSQLTIRFSIRALARGLLAPTEIEIIRPTLRLVRTEAGTFELGFGGGGEPSAAILEGFLANIMGEHGSGPLAYLSSFGMTDAALDVEDRALGVAWHVDDADVVMLRTPRGLDGRVRFDLALGLDRPNVDLRLTYAETTRDIATDLIFSNMRPRSYAERIPALAALAPVDIPLSGRITAKFRLPEAGSGGAGLGIGKTTFKLMGEDGTLRVGERVLHSDVPLRRVDAEGALDVAAGALQIDRLALDLEGGAELAASGWAQRIEDRVGFSMQIDVAGVMAADLPRYWPAGVKGKTREWIAANIREGRVGQGRIEFSGHVGTDGDREIDIETLRGAFDYSGLQVGYFSPLPPVRDIRGHGTLDLSAMTFTVEQGSLNGLSIEEGQVRIDDLGAEIEPLSVDAVVKGPIAKVLEILDSPPLRFVSAVGISPGAVNGQAGSRVAFRLPLIDQLKLADLRFSAVANLADVSVRDALGDLDLRAQALALTLDGAGLEITGDASIGLLAGAVRWRESFAAETPIRSRYEYRGPVTAAAQRQIGIALAPILDGPVDIELAYDVRRDGSGALAGALDLARAALALEVLGWEKPAGKAGAARFAVDLREGALDALTTLEVEAAGLTLEAAGPFLADGAGLDELRISRLTLGRTDMRGIVRPRPAGVTEIVLQGGTADLAPYLESGEKAPDQAGSDQTGPGQPLAISGTLDSVWLGEDRKIEDVTVQARHDGADWQEVSASAALSESGTIEVSMAPEGEGRALTLVSSNAGATLRATDVFNTMIGGQLELKGRFASRRPNSPFAGRIEISDYRVVNAPVMARILASAALQGPLELLSGEGIGFSRLTAPFTYEGRRLMVERSRAYGTALGINALGHVDFRNDTVSLSGTIVPIYTLNRILGSIPIIGSILTGGEGEGVFAVIYKLEGPIEDPSISVNPLSALAPGFLRNLFGMIDGPEPTTPDGVDQR